MFEILSIDTLKKKNLDYQESSPIMSLFHVEMINLKIKL